MKNMKNISKINKFKYIFAAAFVTCIVLASVVLYHYSRENSEIVEAEYKKLKTSIEASRFSDCNVCSLWRPARSEDPNMGAIQILIVNKEHSSVSGRVILRSVTFFCPANHEISLLNQSIDFRSINDLPEVEVELEPNRIVILTYPFDLENWSEFGPRLNNRHCTIKLSLNVGDEYVLSQPERPRNLKSI